MGKIQRLSNETLAPAPGSPGITRQVAFRGEDVLVVRSTVEPAVESGWHHHGDYDVYGYLVSGTVRFEHAPGEGDPVSVRPGDFFHVPARTIHRDVNPSATEGQDVVLFLRGSGPMVVNVEGPAPGR